MLACFSQDRRSARPIEVILATDYPAWVRQQPQRVQNWLTATAFKGESQDIRTIPDADGQIVQVIVIANELNNLWSVGHLPFILPAGIYYFENVAGELLASYAIAWALGAYQFTRYKNPSFIRPQLFLENKYQFQVENTVSAIYLVRDLINTPADDMGPSHLAEVAQRIAQAHDASFRQIIGADLLKENYASIYTVGRASDDAPRLLDIRWGHPSHPKVTLVGKGVCFDTGGLDIKSSSHMLLMKKDMAGSAHVLGLAQMIMSAKLPIALRVLIPAVENAVAGNAYRPGDIIKSRKGLTIEIGNTDAEGRVVLADALTEAVSETPALLIDITTLTGAARVALGTEIAAMFSNQDELANEVLLASQSMYDPIWRLPLFSLYRDYLASNIADINNNSNDPFGGAITAALFLKEFVPDNIPWLHFDMMAWNLRQRPGRPIGGDAIGLRALFDYCRRRFSTT